MRHKKPNVSSGKQSLVSKGSAFKGWTGAEKELFLLHASVYRDALPTVEGKSKRRSLEAFNRYANMAFEEYLMEFDEFSNYLKDCVLGRMTLRDVIVSIERKNSRLAVELDEIVQHPSFSHEDSYRRVANVIEFPLRFDRAGAEANYERLVEVNRSRPCYRPSIGLISIMRTLVEDDEFIFAVADNFAPSHGPGSVAYKANGRVRTGKLPNTVKDSKINVLLLYLLVKSGEWLYPFSILAKSHYGEDQIYEVPCPSVITAVPKSWKKKRLIAIEDVTLQYYEQGVRRALCAGFRHHRYLKKVINLEKPELNAELAQWASLTGAYATVDLSDASDSVGYNFVEECLERTWLWPKIRNARSREFHLPDGRTIESNIFATMGNAICFPVECLVFAAICVEALMLVGKTYEDAFKYFRVYGDDIVISSDAVEVLLERLRAYGFSPNEGKTFTAGAFRESCGGEYLRGRDVCPVRISRKFSGLPTSQNSQQWAAWFDLANRFDDHGCRSARRYAIAKLLDGFSDTPPFSDDGSTGLRIEDPWLAYLTCERYDFAESTTYQSLFAVVTTLWTDVRRMRRDTVFALIEWLSLRGDASGLHFETSSCEKSSKARSVTRAHLQSSGALVTIDTCFI